MGIRNSNLAENYELVIESIKDPGFFQETILKNVDNDPKLALKKKDIQNNLLRSLGKFEISNGYLPLKVDDITNLCTKIAAYDARTILVQLRMDPNVSTCFAGKASRLATRAFKIIPSEDPDLKFEKLYDLFKVFLDEKNADGINLFNQFDFTDAEEKYIIQQLLLDYNIECSLIPETAGCGYNGKFIFNNSTPCLFTIDSISNTLSNQYQHIVSRIYGEAILCEKLAIKGATETFINIKLPEFVRLFNVDAFTLRRWIQTLEQFKLLVHNPLTGGYMLTLSEERYNKVISDLEIKIDETPVPMKVSDVQKASTDYSTSYKAIFEGDELEKKIAKIYETAAQTVSLISDVSSITAALRQRDAIIYEKSSSIEALQQVVADLQAKVSELTEKNKSLTAERNDFREKNRILNHNFDMMCDMLPGRLEDAMSTADQKVLLAVEKYRQHIMSLVKAEIIEQRRIDQINNYFIKMNMDISRATHIDVSKNIPTLAKDRKMTVEDFKLDEEE